MSIHVLQLLLATHSYITTAKRDRSSKALTECVRMRCSEHKVNGILTNVPIRSIFRQLLKQGICWRWQAASGRELNIALVSMHTVCMTLYVCLFVLCIYLSVVSYGPLSELWLPVGVDGRPPLAWQSFCPNCLHHSPSTRIVSLDTCRICNLTPPYSTLTYPVYLIWNP